MKAKYQLALIAIISVILVLAVAWFVKSIKATSVNIEVDDHINITPEQIAQIKAIGEWEFLSVSDEELVDTVRKGLFTDDHLVRIYYGTVRLGINMHHVEPGWIEASGDSILVTLPPIELLDHDFIDEARTKSFHESGRWDGRARESLFKRAHQRMLKRCVTRQNKEAARRNGELQFQQMMKAMGYKYVTIRWQEDARQ